MGEKGPNGCEELHGWGKEDAQGRGGGSKRAISLHLGKTLVLGTAFSRGITGSDLTVQQGTVGTLLRLIKITLLLF